MKKESILLLLLILFMQIRCSDNSSQQVMNNLFLKGTTLISYPISINEILSPVHVVILEDFIVFQNDESNGENVFFVYSYPEWEFCYSFGEIGMGPEEFITPLAIHNCKGNNLYVYDHFQNKIFHYLLEKTGPKYVTEFEMIKNDFLVQNMSFLNDSILLYSIITNEKTSLFSFDIHNTRNLDTLTFQTPLPKVMGNNYNSSFDYFHFSNCGNKLMICFEFINEIRIGEVSDEGYFIINRTIENTNRINKNMTDNILYYFFPATSTNYIFALYYGKSFKNMQPFPLNLRGRDFTFHIEVYNWDKEPINRIMLDTEFLKIIVDEKRKLLYTWNLLKNFTQIHTYDISQID